MASTSSFLLVQSQGFFFSWDSIFGLQRIGILLSPIRLDLFSSLCCINNTAGYSSFSLAVSIGYSWLFISRFSSEFLFFLEAFFLLVVWCWTFFLSCCFARLTLDLLSTLISDGGIWRCFVRSPMPHTFFQIALQSLKRPLVSRGLLAGSLALSNNLSSGYSASKAGCSLTLSDSSRCKGLLVAAFSSISLSQAYIKFPHNVEVLIKKNIARRWSYR